MSELPFYCQIFGSWSLLEPCQKNLLRVKALKKAKKHIGNDPECIPVAKARVKSVSMGLF